VFYVVQHAEKEGGPGDPGLTGLGLRQAARTARWLRGVGLTGVFSSPLQRARETAQAIAAASGGLRIEEDARLRERMNWDGGQPIEEFLTEWETTLLDRDFVPRTGNSSRQAAERFLDCLADWSGAPGPIAVVTHGGVTVDALRTLLGDDALPPGLLRNGVPACAITTLDGLRVVEIASVTHLETEHS
jgi:broad specificity phosphatase PhoE